MKFNPIVGKIVAQSFLTRLVELGNPQQWESPYILRWNPRGGMFTNFATGRTLKGSVNQLFLLLFAGESGLFAGAHQGIKMGLRLKPKAIPCNIFAPIIKTWEEEKEDGSTEKHQYCAGFRYVSEYRLEDFQDGDGCTVQEVLDKYEDEEVPLPDGVEQYQELEQRVGNLGFQVIHSDQTVAYSVRGIPRLNMPDVRNLTDIPTAIRTLLNELGHGVKWLPKSPVKETLPKGMEEAVAELFSMSAAAEWGYQVDISNTIAYIWSWLRLEPDMFSQGKVKFSALPKREQEALDVVKTAMQKSMARISYTNSLMRKLEAEKSAS